MRSGAKQQINCDAPQVRSHFPLPEDGGAAKRNTSARKEGTNGERGHRPSPNALPEDGCDAGGVRARPQGRKRYVSFASSSAQRELRSGSGSPLRSSMIDRPSTPRRRRMSGQS